MWSDERAELYQSIKQSIIWSVWYLMAWTALMIPVTKVML